MNTRALLGSGIASLSILVLGWQLGVQPATVQAGTTAGSTTPTPGTSPETTTPDPDTGTSASTTTDTNTSAVSYTGTTVDHEYGSVTVTITVADGTLTDATAGLSTTHGDKSERINARAVPLLRSEALTAQSAEVSMISGATYTSEAYLESLQSALDQAGL
ncbi:FMN-binding protein [Arthrobacter agilis]|uniref:FMN-binding protein n=1 Tax=Arthrobacter agilis TaxID=37921 RepID=UPI00277EFA32|nr:FMN-binding protein [Arthrobacter agilis]MDQ0734778.1 uncharacterized protein with FMN-binding domain [Arthrobacter agilis]